MHLFFSLLGKYQSSSELFPCQSYISFLPFTESRNCRGWKGPLEIIKSSLSAKQAPYSRLHRWVTRQVLNISREGESTTSLGSLFQFYSSYISKWQHKQWQTLYLCRRECRRRMVFYAWLRKCINSFKQWSVMLVPGHRAKPGDP